MCAPLRMKKGSTSLVVEIGKKMPLQNIYGTYVKQQAPPYILIRSRRIGLKRKSLQEVKDSISSQWNWKKIIKIREFMHKRIKFVIRDDDSTLLQKENWHPFGPLVDRFGSRIAYDVGLDIDYKVKMIIKDKKQRWPIANFLNLLQVNILVQFQPTREKCGVDSKSQG